MIVRHLANAGRVITSSDALYARVCRTKIPLMPEQLSPSRLRRSVGSSGTASGEARVAGTTVVTGVVARLSARADTPKVVVCLVVARAVVSVPVHQPPRAPQEGSAGS